MIYSRQRKRKLVPGGFTWTTYAERLEKAGISWKVYQQKDNYGCNMLENFKVFREAHLTSSLHKKGMLLGEPDSLLIVEFHGDDDAALRAKLAELDVLMGDLGHPNAVVRALEPDFQADIAAVREAREETGLTVEPSELLGVYDRVLRDAEGRVQYHYVLVDFLCRRVAGEIAAASDASEVRWFSREELPGLKLAEDTVDVIRKGFAKLRVGV